VAADEATVAPAVEATFGEWYRATMPPVRGTLVAFTGDPELADEAVADAFTEAFARWPAVAAMGAPRQWVTTVAVNRARRIRRRSLLEAARTRRPPPDLPETEPRNQALWQAVARLPRRQREAVVLRYLADLSEGAVARQLGITTGGASALLHKARTSLRRTLEDPT
jgi:RNA polymerase sigma-70 factor (ECF subfamily)